MSDIALYRKYRPSEFDAVIDQDQVVSVLRKAVKDETHSHAYLFAGSRGTGKTSVARILAKELGTSENDLYEIDAASNRGIDDIRELREAVRALPFESSYKVYIIDEVHMLTKEAFNALLKTLEEPPTHAVFVLATTEMHKLPDTIISRCEVHHFKKPNRKVLTEAVKTIAEKEGYALEDGAPELIALLGDGSFRDAFGVLQKILNTAETKKVTKEVVEEVTGAPKSAMVENVLVGLNSGDVEQALRGVKEASEANIDMKTFSEILIERIRAVLLIRFAPTMRDEIQSEVGEDEYTTLLEIATDKETHITSKTLVTFLEMLPLLSHASVPSLPLELAIMEITKS